MDGWMGIAGLPQHGVEKEILSAVVAEILFSIFHISHRTSGALTTVMVTQ
jgi:hypothetical protein